MSLDDIKQTWSSLPGKVLATTLTIAISGGGGWVINTTVSDHSSISVLAEDIRNLVIVDRDSKAATDASINRIVGIQEEQDREISRLEQAMRDKVKAEFPPPP